MASEDVLPGQNRRLEIHKAIRNSTHFIALLSFHSVGTRGFVQTEQRIAFEMADQHPEGEIYIIPVRLDNCIPTYQRYTDICAVDLFRSYELGLKRIIEALQVSEPCFKKSMGRLYNVPELPPFFLQRPEVLDALKRKILLSDNQPIAITSSRKIGLHGMGGVGKTVLAAALSRDEQIREKYRNGVYWIQLGQTPDIIARQIQLAKTLSEENVVDFVDLQDGKNRLSDLLADRECLLILDDAWIISHVAAFNVLEKHSQLVVTTRNASIIKGLGAERFDLELLTREQSLQLLSEWANCSISHEFADEMVLECGFLPLAIAMVGAMLRNKPLSRWENLLNRLKNADLKKIRQEFPEYAHPSLYNALDISVEALDPELRYRYFDLAIFPDDAAIPVNVLYRFWETENVDESDGEEILDILESLALLKISDDGDLTLHDLQRDYIRNRAADGLIAIHQRFLDAYAKHLPMDNDDRIMWEKGPDDGYFFERLAYHLKSAGRDRELKRLLLDYQWLETRLEISGIGEAISDFDFMDDEPIIHLVQDVLRLSAHILAFDKYQLPGQLHGRLASHEHPEIRTFLAQVRPDYPWIRPLSSSLLEPGGALVRTLSGHTQSVSSVAVTPDGKKIISASYDKTLKVWDMETGIEIIELKGHSDWVLDVCVAPAGNHVISASDDNTLRVWDIETGKTIFTLKGHSDDVLAVAATPDGRQAISASRDATLKVWDITNGDVIETLRGHSDWVTSVCTSPDGKWAISASKDKTVRVWDLVSLKEIYVLDLHTEWIDTVAAARSGQWAVSAARDHTLGIWHIENAEAVRVLSGYGFHMVSISVTPDGHYILGACSDQTIKMLDVEQGKLFLTLRGHSDDIVRVILTDDGKRVISASRDKTVKIWNVRKNKKHMEYHPHTDWVEKVGITPDGQTAVSVSRDESVKVWRFRDAAEVYTLCGHSDWIEGLVLTADGRYAVTASLDGSIIVWNLAEGVGDEIFFSSSDEFSAVAATANADHIVALSHDKILYIRNVGKPEKRYIIHRHTGIARDIAITYHGKRAVTVSEDHIIKLWNLENGKEICAMNGHSGGIVCVDIAADGNRAITGSHDKTIKVWNLGREEEVMTLKRHDDSIMNVAITPDGKCAVSASLDKTLRIWNLETGTLTASFYADAAFNSCAIDASGKHIVAGDRLGSVHFFELHR